MLSLSDKREAGSVVSPVWYNAPTRLGLLFDFRGLPQRPAKKALTVLLDAVLSCSVAPAKEGVLRQTGRRSLSPVALEASGGDCLWLRGLSLAIGFGLFGYKDCGMDFLGGRIQGGPRRRDGLEHRPPRRLQGRRAVIPSTRASVSSARRNAAIARGSSLSWRAHLVWALGSWFASQTNSRGTPCQLPSTNGNRACGSKTSCVAQLEIDRLAGLKAEG